MAQQDRERHILTDDRGRLEQPLVLWREPVDPDGQDSLDCGRNLDVGKDLRQPVRAALAHERLGFNQRPNSLLQEEGIALGPFNQDGREGLDCPVLSKEAVEQLERTLGRQRIEPELGVEGLAPPAVLVLRPVVDEEEEPGRRHAFDEAVQQGLGLGVNPVEVLEGHQERLELGLAQEQALDRVQRALSALGRVERLPLGVFAGHVEEGKERRERRLKGAVQHEDPSRHLFPDLTGTIAVADTKIAFKQIDHG